MTKCKENVCTDESEMTQVDYVGTITSRRVKFVEEDGVTVAYIETECISCSGENEVINLTDTLTIRTTVETPYLQDLFFDLYTMGIRIKCRGFLSTADNVLHVEDMISIDR